MSEPATEQNRHGPDAGSLEPSPLLRAIFDVALRIPFTLIGSALLQGLATLAVVYYSLVWLLRESLSSLETLSLSDFADFSGDIARDAFLFFAQHTWLITQAFLLIGFGMLAARTLAKLIVARRTVDLVRGGTSFASAASDVLVAWPLYAISFAVTRFIVLIGFLALGLPGLALLLLFALFAPMFAIAGPRPGSLLSALDFLNGSRLIALLAVYAVLFVVTLALISAALVLSVLLALWINAELIATLSAIDYSDLFDYLFASDAGGASNGNESSAIELQAVALRLALSGSPLWLAFGISDAVLTLAASTAFGHYQLSREASAEESAAFSTASTSDRPGASSGSGGGEAFSDGGPSSRDESPWS